MNSPSLQLSLFLVAALAALLVSTEDTGQPPSERSKAPNPEHEAEISAENDVISETDDENGSADTTEAAETHEEAKTPELGKTSEQVKVDIPPLLQQFGLELGTIGEDDSDPAQHGLEEYEFDEDEDEVNSDEEEVNSDEYLPPGTYMDAHNILWPLPIKPEDDDVALAISEFTPECQPGCVEGQGVCVAYLDEDGELDSTCSCFSGYSGTVCERRPPRSCNMVKLSAMGMGPSPKLEMFEMGKRGRLDAMISVPVVEGRVNMSFQIGVNTSNPMCRYPGPYWVKLPVQNEICKDNFVSRRLIWGDLVGCNLARDFFSKPGVTVYNGRITVRTEDYIKDVFRGPPMKRKNSAPLTFKLNVPGYTDEDEKFIQSRPDIDANLDYKTYGGKGGGVK